MPDHVNVARYDIMPNMSTRYVIHCIGNIHQDMNKLMIPRSIVQSSRMMFVVAIIMSMMMMISDC